MTARLSATPAAGTAAGTRDSAGYRQSPAATSRRLGPSDSSRLRIGELAAGPVRPSRSVAPAPSATWFAPIQASAAATGTAAAACRRQARIVETAPARYESASTPTA